MAFVVTQRSSGSRLYDDYGSNSTNTASTNSAVMTNVNGSSSRSGDNETVAHNSNSEEKSTVRVRLIPSMSDAMGGDIRVPDFGATVVSGFGTESKELGSDSWLEFRVPCGETITITIYDSTGEYEHSGEFEKYVPCGQSVVNLGYMRIAPA